MSKIELPTVTSGYNMSTINNNFQKIEDTLNKEVLYRKGYLGEPNEMQTNLDMNGKQILNVATGTSDGSLVTKGYVDQGLALKFDKSGGQMSGSVDMGSNEIINVSRLSANTLEIGGVQVVPTDLVVDPYNGTREALRRSYAEAGYNLVDGSFETGGTLVNSNDVLLQESTGKAFSGPAGTISAGTNPASGGFVDQSQSLPVSEKIKTKYGTLNVYMDRMAYAPAIGILTTNTPAQNTAALNAIRAVGGISLYIPAGTFQFDVFATTGLFDVSGSGKDLTIVEVSGASSAAMVQPGPINHKGIWFKSIAGSKDSCRVNVANYSKFESCKISNFIHSVPAPNAWGVYLDKIKGARLTNVEFDNNSQADIAIVEGVTDLIIDGCFHTSGQLHINFEPNNGIQPINGVLLLNMQINKLSLLCNDLNYATDSAVVVQGCVVNQLRYDGLGASFIETKINTFLNQPDGDNRLYGANITGIKVGSKELVPDPSFSDVGDAGSNLPWSVLYSTTPAVNRYNRSASGDLTVCVNSVMQATQLKTQLIPCKANTPYLFTICKKLEAGGSRPNMVSVMFKDSSGVDIGTRFALARKLFADRFDRHQHIVVSPSNAASMELRVSGCDTDTTFQSISYRYFSVREIDGQGIGIDSSSIGNIQFPSRIKNKFTKSQVDSLQYFHAPLPVGTEIEFAYTAGVDVTRLAVVTAQAADNTGKFGTLRIIAKYP